MKVVKSILLVSVVGALSLAQAENTEYGEKIFKRKCASCHSLRPGKHKVGPSLHGVYESKAASTDFRRYSPELAESGYTWNDKNLDAFLTKPREFIKHNRMAFAGLRKKKDREAIITYLKESKLRY
jgi:cytochrome c